MMTPSLPSSNLLSKSTLAHTTTMMRRALASAWNRRAWQASSKSSQGAKKVAAMSVGVVALSAGVGLATSRDDDTSNIFSSPNTCFCDNVILVSNENSEEERFEQCVAYHRCFLDDYRERWQYRADVTPKTSSWPLYIPDKQQISAIEYDLTFCKNASKKNTYCADLKFRLACYYLRQEESPQLQKEGFQMITQLAREFHTDSMCMYGILLNEGKLVEADSKAATVFWRRAVDMTRHVQSTYELAVAFYTGEGVPESEELAVHYFEKAATLGHAGAAYMLGDCLLDGVGAPRDRAEALEWLVAAGELGHRGARSRVLAVLENDPTLNHGRFTDKSRQSLVDEQEDEATKWTNIDDEDGLKEVSVERRYTIGGGSGNPVVLVKRKTTVAESRTP